MDYSNFRLLLHYFRLAFFFLSLLFQVPSSNIKRNYYFSFSTNLIFLTFHFSIYTFGEMDDGSKKEQDFSTEIPFGVYLD